LHLWRWWIFDQEVLLLERVSCWECIGSMDAELWW
jgi:hypothetical protein